MSFEDCKETELRFGFRMSQNVSIHKEIEMTIRL